MLYANDGVSERCTIDPAPHADAPDLIWLDLLKPTDTERSLAERLTGLRVPAVAELEEIESSSRLSTENGVLYLSSPMHYLDDNGVSHASALGFVLSDKYLMTIRFAELPSFDAFAKHFPHERGRHAAHGPAPCSVAAFVGLLETSVDRLADVLEHMGAELDTISRRVFRPEVKSESLTRTDAQLRATLRNIGRTGDRLSNLRDSLLGIMRIAQYTAEVASDWVPQELRPRFITLKQDILSLNDYDAQLMNKVQFLLDATLGFINIEQNTGIKILTVVSVMGIPPTLIAGIYGMNFKWIPELQWEYGYIYAWIFMIVSAVVPLLWFKKKGWA